MANQRIQSWKALELGSKHYLALESMLLTIMLVLDVYFHVINYLKTWGLNITINTTSHSIKVQESGSILAG